MTNTDWRNKLYFGDNLDILRENVADESVDLIYLDPPFNSNATYNVLFRERTGEDSAGIYTPEHYPDHRYPRVQVLTIEDLLSGTQAEYPRFAPEATLPRAPRRRRASAAQGRLA